MIINLVYVSFLFVSHETRRERWQQRGPDTWVLQPPGTTSQHRDLRRLSAATKGEAELVPRTQKHLPGPTLRAHPSSKTPDFHSLGPEFRQEISWVFRSSLNPRGSHRGETREGVTMGLTHLFNQDLLITS